MYFLPREYIIRSQKHDCRNWDCGRAVPFSGNNCFEFSVLCLCSAENCEDHGSGSKCVGVSVDDFNGGSTAVYMWQWNSSTLCTLRTLTL